MNTILDTIRNTLPDVSVTEQEPMKAHCSFRTGGPAAAFLVPEDEGSMLKLLAVLSENEIPFIVLGNGTNVVFRDESLPYCIISTEKLQEISLTEEGYVSAQAGAALSRVATFAYENSLTGMEFASGIPGSAGGGVLMNAGAYGGELKDIIDNSETMQSLANAPVPKDCLSCRYSGKCRGGAKCVTYAQTGLLFAKDVNCWL